MALHQTKVHNYQMVATLPHTYDCDTDVTVGRKQSQYCQKIFTWNHQNNQTEKLLKSYPLSFSLRLETSAKKSAAFISAISINSNNTCVALFICVVVYFSAGLQLSARLKIEMGKRSSFLVIPAE